MLRRMTIRKSLAILLVAAAAGCGGSDSSSSPSSPSSPAAVDLTGAWFETTGDLAWQLAQTGSTVTGTSQFSQDSGLIGPATGRGTVTGVRAGGSVTFTDTYPVGSLSVPNCSIVASGTLTISGNQMSGRFAAVNSCNGAVLGTENGTLVMMRR